MSNHEGYADWTADIAIARVTREEQRELRFKDREHCKKQGSFFDKRGTHEEQRYSDKES